MLLWFLIILDLERGESLIVYRATDLKLQLDTLRMENLEPLEKINKLIELYITKYTLQRWDLQNTHFEFSSKKINLETLSK
jgi:hypothetical protein